MNDDINSSLPSRRQIARPIRRAAPVTIAVRPGRLRSPDGSVKAVNFGGHDKIVYGEPACLMGRQSRLTFLYEMRMSG